MPALFLPTSNEAAPSLIGRAAKVLVPDDADDLGGQLGAWFLPSPTSPDGTDGWVVLEHVDPADEDAIYEATGVDADAARDFRAELAQYRVDQLDAMIDDLRAGIEWVDAVAARESEQLAPVLDALVAAKAAVERLSTGVVNMDARNEALAGLRVAAQNVEITGGAVTRARLAADRYREHVAQEIARLEERRRVILEQIS